MQLLFGGTNHYGGREFFSLQLQSLLLFSAALVIIVLL